MPTRKSQVKKRREFGSQPLSNDINAIASIFLQKLNNNNRMAPSYTTASESDFKNLATLSEMYWKRTMFCTFLLRRRTANIENGWLIATTRDCQRKPVVMVTDVFAHQWKLLQPTTVTSILPKKSKTKKKRNYSSYRQPGLSKWFLKYCSIFTKPENIIQSTQTDTLNW